MMGMVMVLLLVSAVCVGRTEGAVSCDNYNPDICLPDLRMICLTNGTMMQGTCYAQAAVCREGAKEATDPGCCSGTAPCVALNSASVTRSAVLGVCVSVAFNLLRSCLS